MNMNTTTNGYGGAVNTMNRADVLIKSSLVKLNNARYGGGGLSANGAAKVRVVFHWICLSCRFA
jgi:hypothetical protein